MSEKKFYLVWWQDNTSILILCINSLNLDKIYLKNINNEQHIYMPTTLQAIQNKCKIKMMIQLEVKQNWEKEWDKMTMSMCLVTVLVPGICYQNEVIPVSVINKHQLIGALTRIQYKTLVCMRFFRQKVNWWSNQDCGFA